MRESDPENAWSIRERRGIASVLCSRIAGYCPLVDRRAPRQTSAGPATIQSLAVVTGSDWLGGSVRRAAQSPYPESCGNNPAVVKLFGILFPLFPRVLPTKSPGGASNQSRPGACAPEALTIALWRLYLTRARCDQLLSDRYSNQLARVS